MKTRILIIALLAPFFSHSQMQIEAINYGETQTGIRAVGLGNFSGASAFGARLHINNFELFDEFGSLNGFLFRSDGDEEVDNRWQLFTGPSSTSQTERFRIRTLAGGYDTYLERTQPGSEADVRLLTAEIQIRARNKRLGDFCEISTGADEIIMGDGSDVNFTALSSTNRRLFIHGSNGFMGIGSNFAEMNLNPNFNVHVHDSSNVNVYQQFTNLSTGSTSTDGLLIGLNQTAGTSELRSRDQSRWLDILESDTVRMRFRDLNSINVWPHNPGTTSYVGVNRIMVPLRGQDANTVPGSMMQLGTAQDGNISRPWQNIGTTYGGNADAMYVGLMERANPTGGAAQTDAVLTWGCQVGSTWNSAVSDNFRIMFLTSMQSSDPDSSGSAQGMEVLRISPFGGSVGIGNFSTNSLQGPGTADYVNAKLDIDGDLRIREVLEDETLHQILVRDPNDHGRVKWRDVGTITGQCDWNMITNGSSNDLVMGYTGACNEGNVGIGLNNPTAKLDVFKNASGSNANQTGLKVNLMGGTLVNYGAKIDLSANPTNTSTVTYGVAATSQGGFDKNFGGHFEAISITGSSSSVGVYGFATTSTANAEHLGLYGSASNTRRNFGVRGSVLSNNFYVEGVGVDGTAQSNNNFLTGSRPLFGVRGIANASNHCGYRPVGVYGEVQNINSSCPFGYAGYFNGNVLVTGDITANSFTTSDENLKENVLNIEGALEVVGQLNPVSYNFKCDEYPQLNLLAGQRLGFIAQEVEQIIPGITKQFETLPTYDDAGNVQTEGTTFLAMNYNELHAIEVAAIQELQSRLDILQAQLDACCASTDLRSNESSKITTDVELSDQSIVLNQNVPNPFAEKTTISYRIDNPFSRAQMLFYNSEGRLIQSVEIAASGNGQLNVFADDLSNGIYSYTLVVDGKIIDTKKMIKK